MWKIPNRQIRNKSHFLFLISFFLFCFALLFHWGVRQNKRMKKKPNARRKPRRNCQYARFCVPIHLDTRERVISIPFGVFLLLSSSLQYLNGRLISPTFFTNCPIALPLPHHHRCEYTWFSMWCTYKRICIRVLLCSHHTTPTMNNTTMFFIFPFFLFSVFPSFAG